MPMKRFFGAVALAMLVMMPAASLQADTLTYDTSLVSPPGFYNGTGNANTNFTVDTAGDLELGLSVIDRFVGPIDPGAGSNIYAVTPSAGPLADWDFAFSVNTQAGGGSDVLGTDLYALTVQDITASTTGPTFDPVRIIGDDSGYGASGKTAGVNLATEWGAQNDENLGFAGFLPGFNPNSPDLYKITLSAFTQGDVLIGSVSVYANAATPEPKYVSLMGLGMLALVLIARRANPLKKRGDTRLSY
jgi:hypothetical protein